jgi:hypothetical protein
MDMHAKKHKREGIVRSCNKLLLYLLKELMCIVHRKILAFYALWRLTFWKLKCLDVTHSVNFGTYSSCQRLNMELDLQSLFGLDVHSCTHWLRHRTPPPRIWAHIRGRYWSAKIDYISL